MGQEACTKDYLQWQTVAPSTSPIPPQKASNTAVPDVEGSLVLPSIWGPIVGQSHKPLREWETIFADRAHSDPTSIAESASEQTDGRIVTQL